MISSNPYLQFGPGSDAAAWLAGGFALAIFGALVLARAKLKVRRPRAWLALLCVSAALLSHGYVRHYLRGGPRIVDATYYWLEARAIAAGHFTFPALDPPSAVRGRFLVSPATDPSRVGVLFPPGYPLVLALAMLASAPLWLGPALAALLVAFTYAAARAWGFGERVALIASGLSVSSATLRYHTADTMSHGLSALLVLVAVWAVARGRLLGSTRDRIEHSQSRLPSRVQRAAWALVFGLATGLQCATRPITGAVLLGSFVVGAALVGYSRLRAHRATRLPIEVPLAVLIGWTPGIGLLLAYQGALTGSLWDSVQLAYYRVADGPPGCFRYGFGAGIGCWFEHGDYVRARLPRGYGALEALATTGRRLLTHSMDLANAAPLALGLPLACYWGRREQATRYLAGLVVGVIAAYAPFYFEGSYPGGGARFFVDALPLEHILLARALSALPRVAWVWPVSLLGFALHTSSQHRLLRDREGGRPMYEPELLSARGVTRGLVYVRTDNAFALGHDPRVRSPRDGVWVVRERSDASDYWLWRGLGQPPAYRYRYDPFAAQAVPTIAPLTASELEALGASRRFEAEGSWPPSQIWGGWAHPVHAPEACVSAGRGLLVRPAGETVQLRLLLPRPGRWSLSGWSPPEDPSVGSSVQGRVPGPAIRVRYAQSGSKPAEIPIQLESREGACWRAVIPENPLGPSERTLDLVLSGSTRLDFFELESSPSRD